MTRPAFVKICGVTTIDDACFAAEAGANAIGLNFYARSPRCLSVKRARAIVDALPPFVWAVGVFVNESVKNMERIVREARLDAAQLHGDEGALVAKQLTCRTLKALHIDDAPVDRLARAFTSVDALVLDAAQSGYGGGGVTFDWALARTLAAKRPVLLAGGLHADNVAKAIRAVHPFGVDVASGVEQPSKPGVKDPRKVAAFIRAARSVR